MGHRRGDLIGRHCCDLLAPSQQESRAAPRGMREAASGSGTEITFRDVAGRHRIGSITATPIVEQGRVTRRARHRSRRHAGAALRGGAAAAREARGGRPARERRGARAEQPARRHHRVRAAARGRRPAHAGAARRGGHDSHGGQARGEDRVEPAALQPPAPAGAHRAST